MKKIEVEVRGIVRELFKDTPEWPLPARQCIHWAAAERPDILQEFMVDLVGLAHAAGDASVIREAEALLDKVQGLARAHNEPKARMYE